MKTKHKNKKTFVPSESLDGTYDNQIRNIKCPWFAKSSIFICHLLIIYSMPGPGTLYMYTFFKFICLITP